jgi:hypothetical protein
VGCAEAGGNQYAFADDLDSSGYRDVHRHCDFGS